MYKGVNFEPTGESEEEGESEAEEFEYTIDYVDNNEVTEDNSRPAQLSLPQSSSNSLHSGNGNLIHQSEAAR